MFSHRYSILLVSLALSACGSIDPEPITDEDGNPIIMPGPFDDHLGVTALYGAEVGVRPTLRFQFDAFVNEDQLLDFGVVALSSGGIAASGRIRWQMSSRTMAFRPFNPLVAGLRYRPSIDASRVFSVTGAPLGAIELPEFVVSDEIEEPEFELPMVRWAAVDDVFRAKCRSCHADPQWQLNPLTYASLVGGASAQTDELLVVPFDPGDSYLLHKVIEDYPVRRFSVQPPPWSNAATLTAEEVVLIERWVATGARD